MSLKRNLLHCKLHCCSLTFTHIKFTFTRWQHQTPPPSPKWLRRKSEWCQYKSWSIESSGYCKSFSQQTVNGQHFLHNICGFVKSWELNQNALVDGEQVVKKLYNFATKCNCNRLRNGCCPVISTFFLNIIIVCWNLRCNSESMNLVVFVFVTLCTSNPTTNPLWSADH